MLERLVRHWLRVVVFVASVFGALFTSAPAAMAQSASGLTVQLSVPAASFKASEGVWVDFTLANPSAVAVSVLIWNTPFEGIRNDIFRVSKDGQPVAYQGPKVKRAAPRQSDYLTLAAGETKTIRVDLAGAYAIAGIGSYRVHFDGTLLDVATVTPGAAPAADRIGKGANLPLSSAEVTLQVTTGRTIEYTPVPGGTSPSLTGTNTFNSCSAPQRNQLTAARLYAYKMAYGATNALVNTPLANRPTARRSKLWFGTYTATRYALVRTHYKNISTALNTAAFTFDCTCTDSGVYAYVYPNSPYSVYLCGAFWAAPLYGTDSKAGTLVHESSHFTILAGTDDYVYGQSGAKSLAISNPANAVMNADNHEYFAENTPGVAQP